MKNNKHNKEFIVFIFFTLTLLITSVYYVRVKDIEKIFRILLNFITITGAYLLYISGFLKGSRVIYYINMIFIFLSMYLASILNFYSIKNYDKFLHLLSGFVIAIIGYVLFLYLTNEKSREEMSPLAATIFVVLFSIATAGAWEIWEFTTDSIFGLNAQNGNLNDTMWDIICGTGVGIITSIPIYLHDKGRQVRIIRYIIDDIKR